MERTANRGEQDVLKGALKSLVNALDVLEDAVDHHVDDCRKFHTLNDEMSDMMLDRSKLAQSLDQSEARAQRLEEANKEVSRRLVTAMESIRSVLEARK
ncbi:MAG: DUF4164 domain-containing protein [Pseudomonadota bacterium]